MNSNYNDFDMNEMDSSTEKHHKFKFRFLDILLFIGCLIAAFIFWCYALYSDDPVIEKTVTVNFVLENAQEGDQLAKSSTRIVVYGEQSILANTRYITVRINRSQFDSYNKDTVIQIDLPDELYSETNEVTLKLTNQSNK